MEYKTRTVEQHTVTLSNGVTVTRGSLADLVHTVNVQVENQRTTVRCINEHANKEFSVLVALELDLRELHKMNSGVAK